MRSAAGNRSFAGATALSKQHAHTKRQANNAIERAHDKKRQANDAARRRDGNHTGVRQVAMNSALGDSAVM